LNPYLSAEYAQITFKKTSWKKAATFLKKFLEKEGVVKTKDRGGETVIMSINWNHKLITEFQPYRLSPKEVSKPGPAENESSSGPKNQMLQIRELYKPAGKALKSILEAQSKS
jgi:translation initiation factor 2D